MKTTLMMLSMLLTLPALSWAQTMYKCPSPTPGLPAVYQQMPCTPQGGGDQIKIVPVKPVHDESAEATARMKAYSDSLNEQKKQKETHHSDNKPRADSLDDHIEMIKKEELAKDCYAFEKRIHWIRKKEKEGAHLERDSMMDDDSREAIEQYEEKCGDWK